ncbi:MarR family transcriptional regulator [Micromonospora auratinigra]|uniref:DNA-binding transcriptional regulator, MarR family n=1 Tax=Micromonospora auratinigra TaxID=261654 RepID=A0A1A9A0T0_9ACTN|nr:MarR family transcriptional regulator [Micromonospora auratinigra]SBT49806.1 DNA-binding transcriptional regulator, MarR family [Micromonospora auratinigra]
MADDTQQDLLDSSHWGPVWGLLHAADRDIAALYDEAGVTGLRTRFVGPLIKLGRHGPMTIQELATAVEVTHSAMSQTAAAMRAAGFVDSADSADGRTRRIRLSERGRELLPLLQAEWRATEATVRELEAETPYPLSRAVEDINAALARRSFKQRLADNLARALDGDLR